MSASREKYKKGLYKALASLKTQKQMELFMLDLCTPAELEAFAERWEIANLLHQGKMSYRDIAKETGASTTTVARVNRFLNQEPHKGYKQLLK